MKIENVKIVNFDQIIKNANILIENGKIKKIEIIEGEGKYIVVPGFVDTHIHGFGGFDVMDSTKSVEEISKLLAKHGTTSFMPTAMTNKWNIILQSLKNIESAKNLVSRNLGIHIEGPYLGVEKKGAHNPEWLRVATKEELQSLIKASKNTLKKISFDPRNLSIDLIKFLVEENIIASVGHSAATFDQAQKAYESGASCTCHMWNAMSGIDSRIPGILQAAFMNNSVYGELIVDFKHVSEKSVLFTIKNKGIEKIICVSDAIRPAYGPDGYSNSGGVIVDKKNLLIVIKGTNTIAGSGICLHDSFKNLISIGVSINDAVRMTSWNAVQNLKLTNIGYIGKNYYADFVVMDKNNFKIKDVYINGVNIKEKYNENN